MYALWGTDPGPPLNSSFQDEHVQNFIKESILFDATQRKLPKRIKHPYMNWNPVIDKMNRPLPYEPKATYNWGFAREYGIPIKRRL